MAVKLSVWNATLRELGHRPLEDTGEPVEAGRLLTAAWPEVLQEALEAGSWNFATETIRADADTGVMPAFGFHKVFAKPADWVRTVGVSEDEFFSLPLLHYYDDQTFWSADNTPIYVRYVSNDTGMGLELTRWTASFRRFIELELAARIAYKIEQSKVDDVKKDRDKARRTALNHDAMNENQPKFAPMGSWNSARAGRFGGGRRDRGNRGSLIG
jgi:hypothetical protein